MPSLIAVVKSSLLFFIPSHIPVIISVPICNIESREPSVTKVLSPLMPSVIAFDLLGIADFTLFSRSLNPFSKPSNVN